MTTFAQSSVLTIRPTQSVPNLTPYNNAVRQFNAALLDPSLAHVDSTDMPDRFIFIVAAVLTKLRRSPTVQFRST